MNDTVLKHSVWETNTFSQFLGGMTHISNQIIKHRGKERGDWGVGVEGEKNRNKKKKQKRKKNEERVQDGSFPVTVVRSRSRWTCAYKWHVAGFWDSEHAYGFL